MAILYKTFHVLRTVLSVLALCFLSMAPVQAASSLFTVEKIVVDVSADNALKAREQAFEQAQVKAFGELAGRMLSEGELARFQMPPALSIAPMIQDYEVSNEKLSSKRYSGTYKFRFKDRSVKQYFSGQGAQYTDVASQPLLILPFLENTQGMMLWSHENGWMQAWSATPNLNSGLVPLIVPLGDLDDVRAVGDGEALTYDKRNVYAMLERYNASEAVVVIARPEGSSLNVQIYRTDRARPEYVHQIIERDLPNQTQDMLYMRAVQSVKAALRKDWKQKTVVDAHQGGTLQVRVSFNSLQEWADVQRALGRVYGISEINLKALSPKEAYLELLYDGNLERLKLALQQADLALGEPRYQPASAGGRYRRGNADYSEGLLGAYNKKSGSSAIYDLYKKQRGYANPAAGTPSQYQSRF